MPGLREVVPNQTVPEDSRPRDIWNVRTGGTASTLQELTLPDGAGGMAYRVADPAQDPSAVYTRNRFVSWRTQQDLLELTETSLDWNLVGQRVRYRFQDTPILSGGVSVHETLSSVVVLVPTVSSVHKITFPHPRRIHRQQGQLLAQARAAAEAGAGGGGDDTDAAIPSVFAEAQPHQAKEHCHVIPTAGTTPMPHLASSWLSPTDEAVFALANSAGTISLVTLGNVKGMVTVNQLKTGGSYLGRLWGNLALAASSAGGGVGGAAHGQDAASAEAVMSLAISPVDNDVFVFGLCKDHKIRMWSATTFDCVMVENVVSFTVNDPKQLQQGSQNHQLRRVCVEGGQDGGGGKGVSQHFSVELAIFLCFAHHAQFCVLRPVMADGRYKLTHRFTIYSPKHDLIDFQMTPSHLWALWTNSDGAPVLASAAYASSSSGSCLHAGDASLASAGHAAGWSNVLMTSDANPVGDAIADADGVVASSSSGGQSTDNFDPRQAYLQLLFHPGRFSVQTLAKTVTIYTRSMDLTSVPHDQLTVGRLRDEVGQAVENEIQQHVSEYEITDDEYLHVSQRAWSRFYSCALQYQQAGRKPMGLVCDSRSELTCVVKKAGLSFLRPVDALEYLVQQDSVAPGHKMALDRLFGDTPLLHDDPSLAQDVVRLISVVGQVDALTSIGQMRDFAHALARFDPSPDQAARRIVRELLADGDEATQESLQEVSRALQQVVNVSGALEWVLMSLDLNKGIVAHRAAESEDMDDDGDMEEEGDSCRAFSSNMGVGVLAESLAQLTNTRLSFTRSLLVLQLLIQECDLSNSVSSNAAEAIRSTHLPFTVVMAHSYFMLVWVTESVATAPPANSLEQSLCQMAVLKISPNEASYHTHTLSQLTRRLAVRPLTLSELFLRGPGGRRARALLTPDARLSPAAWRSMLMPLLSVSAQLLWPGCSVSVFPDFLLAACQHMQVQEYVRLLSPWCEWRTHSRQFLLGSALLNMGEPEKACDWMLRASAGVGSDPFLMRRLFRPEEVRPVPAEDKAAARAEADRLSVLYFLKVIELFQQFGYYDFVIEVARTAIDVCDPDDPNKTTLCYILFSHHLKLGHNNEAYDAMIMNPDQSRRKDSLRQFVVTLFERRQLSQLASYPYVDMFEDLEQIIEARARSVDLNVNNYYDFLYSFHIMKENYRKAAYAMYECGMRLGTELFTNEGLKRQAKCYLSCLNCLRLVSPQYAWIVKPVPYSADGVGVSPKRSHDGDELPGYAHGHAPRMDVLELKDIEREFELVSARLQLSKRHALAGPSLSAGETVSLLVAANLYEDAVRIGGLFRLDPRPVLEGLSSRCVQLSRSALDRDAAWEWLALNNPSGTDIRSGSAVEAAWKLLRDLLERLEEPGMSGLHKAVATRLFSQGATLPAWLVASYKKTNPAELLRLYMCHGFLEDASLLAVEYISAVLGTGKEYFGLDHSLQANNVQPVWLPYNTLDQLLLELKDNGAERPLYRKLYNDLDSKITTYLDTVERVSQDMMSIRRHS